MIEVNGLLDPVLVDFIDRSLDESLEIGAMSVVLQMESSGAAVDDAVLAALVDKVANFDIPVSVWLGPSGSPGHRRHSHDLALATSRIGISRAPRSRSATACSATTSSSPRASAATSASRSRARP